MYNIRTLYRCIASIYLSKVTVSYCVVGHTHEDIDAIIGTVITYLRNHDIQSFHHFDRTVRHAINKKHAQVNNFGVITIY